MEAMQTLSSNTHDSGSSVGSSHRYVQPSVNADRLEAAGETLFEPGHEAGAGI